jgi:hypothetical protein
MTQNTGLHSNFQSVVIHGQIFKKPGINMWYLKQCVTSENKFVKPKT